MASSKISLLKKLGISAAVGGVAVLGTPLVVSAAGFGAAGIAAGTLAAKLMTLTTTYGAGACVVGYSPVYWSRRNTFSCPSHHHLCKFFWSYIQGTEFKEPEGEERRRKR
ncbi:interferon alpha-inducible protein 27-like protein 2B [Pomacea canaliculata]|uniref:interferon alpha-inducible protein 27-like protein 2B n=1 Tax=Pomacea canaliculata TaxID=400727 RepID=UPI000D73C02B|nr:interferon alpha-inducible protein 27-like protein 2B [Pomacea canaliculata]